MSIKDLNAKSVKELNDYVVEQKREQFKLRMQKATSQSNQTHLAKALRKNVARAKTVITQKGG
jgi:large subunit ribosomal protein L29